MRPTTMPASLAIAIMLAVPVATATAQDGSDICDLISIDELNTLSSVTYEGPHYGKSPLGLTCKYPADGPHRLEINVSDVQTLDSVRGRKPGGSDILVNDHPAYSVTVPSPIPVDHTATHTLAVDFGRELVTIIVEHPEESVDFDAETLALAIAEVAAGRVLAGDDAQLGVPDVDGIEWSRHQDVVSAEELIGGDENVAALWQPIFDATGAEPSDLLTLNVRAFKPGTTDELGLYSVLHIGGVDENALRSGFIDFMRNASGGDVEFDDISLGGRDVQRVAAGDGISGVLYFDGDTAHMFTMPDEDAARVIEALP